MQRPPQLARGEIRTPPVIPQPRPRLVRVRQRRPAERRPGWNQRPACAPAAVLIGVPISAWLGGPADEQHGQEDHRNDQREVQDAVPVKTA
jgi:hypothetical protein